MSRSFNQSRHAYKGRQQTGKECWSKRCHLVNMFPLVPVSGSREVKYQTRRFERRQAAQEIRQQVLIYD